MNGTDTALDFILETSWETLPETVRHQAKRALLDLFGALLAGVGTPVGDLMADFCTEQYGGTEATLLVSGRKASAVGAALANGFFQNALDIDDGYRPTKGHPGACVLSVILAAAERRGEATTGREFLCALIVGYELGIRAALIRHATYACYHSSGSWGAVSGAGAAGKLLGLDRDALRRAMGCAESHAPICPMMKGIDRPCMVKDGIGWGAGVAMASVLMAQRGFTGIEPLFADAPDPSLVSSLGRQWLLMGLYHKPYAACRWAQPAVAGALKVASEHRLAPEEIAKVRVRTFVAATRLSRAHPRNTEEAQYNLAFPVAAALVDGEVGPRQVLPPRLHAPEILSLMDRIEAVAEEEFEAEFPGKARGAVEVETTEGRVFFSGVMDARWEPPQIPTDAELEAKFLWLVQPVLGEARARALCDLLWDLDAVPDAARALITLSVAGT